MNLPRPNLRRGLTAFISEQDYTHAITLNAERALSLRRLESIFSTFCITLDRTICGKQRVTRIPSRDRFRAIAFPEHLETNAHLHVAADLRPLKRYCGSNIRMRQALHFAWMRATHGAGSVDLQPITSSGWANYMVKDVQWNDPIYFLASDFHPDPTVH